MMATITFNTERMQEAADDPNAAAVDLAEFLVSAGVPFRDAHAIVGGLVREALEGSATLVELTRAHPQLGPAAAQLLTPGVPVTNRTTRGAAGPKAVAAQLERFQDHLATVTDSWPTS
jgi:argininosuccinate lyase